MRGQIPMFMVQELPRTARTAPAHTPAIFLRSRPSTPDGLHRGPSYLRVSLGLAGRIGRGFYLPLDLRLLGLDIDVLAVLAGRECHALGAAGGLETRLSDARRFTVLECVEAVLSGVQLEERDEVGTVTVLRAALRGATVAPCVDQPRLHLLVASDDALDLGVVNLADGGLLDVRAGAKLLDETLAP